MTDGETPPTTTTSADGATAPASTATTATTTDGAEGATTTNEPAPQADWRKSLAGENADWLKGLERFTDPGKFVESYFEAQRVIREGGRVKVPGADATPEEIAAWNKARGVPESADKYEIKVKPPEGIEVGEPTKQLLSSVTERLHKLGADAATVNFAHEMIYEQLAGEIAARTEAASAVQAATAAALKAKWGSEYEPNVKYAYQVLAQNVGKPVADSIAGLELADGSRLGDNQLYLEAMAQIGLQFREDPNFLEDPETRGASVDDQITSILKMRETADGLREYDKPETQAKLKKLYEQQARQKPRAA